MISKLQITFFILCYLVVFGYYNIIFILIFIYYFWTASKESDEIISIMKEVKKLNEIIKQCSDSTLINRNTLINGKNIDYYDKFVKLEELQDKYSLKDIRMEQIKIINQMLYLVELDKEHEAFWDSIKLNLYELY
jgi:hypothetical protein